MENWKVEEHEMTRFNYLAGKIDQLVDDPKNSPKMTTQEIIEFMQIWQRRQFDLHDRHDTSYINYIKQGLNEGDTNVLYK